MADGRNPRWDLLTDWEHESQARHEIAIANHAALGGYLTPAPGQTELFAASASRGGIRNYMWLWAGKLESALTAGWLAVPVLGETPFASVASLWWDGEDDGRQGARTRRPVDGPNFDQRSVTEPSLTLKQQPAGEGQA